jgi:hypothetical protein
MEPSRGFEAPAPAAAISLQWLASLGFFNQPVMLKGDDD